jgi:hypothetical protein
MQMNKRYYLLFLLTVLITPSCNKKVSLYEGAQVVSSKDFGEKIKLPGEEFVFNCIWEPHRIKLLDSLFLLINANTDYHIQILNPKTLSEVGQFISYGEGPNEMIHPELVKSFNSNIWIFDQPSQNLYEFLPDSFFPDRQPNPIRTIKLHEKSDNVAVLSENQIISLTTSTGKRRFNSFDINGNYQEIKGEYPVKGDSEVNLMMSYTGDYTTNFKNRILMTYYYTDLIEIYDFEGNLIKRIHGPDLFYPAFKEATDGKYRGVRSSADSKFAYISPICVNNEVFILYSGKNYRDPDAELCNMIMVFDWEGNPLRQYELDKNVFTITADAENKIIYGLSVNPEYCIVRFKY